MKAEFDLDSFLPTNIGGGVQRHVGNLGMWGLHLAKLAFLAYSTFHGIHAARAYAEDGLALTFQIVGIAVTELTLLSLYLSWHNGRITNMAQKLAAFSVYTVGFLLACAAIVADSQATAGYELTPWLQLYLAWVLPIAPAVMALGALLVHSLSPDAEQTRTWAAQQVMMDGLKHKAQLALENAELEEAKTLQAIRLQSRFEVLRSLQDFWRQDGTQRLIHETAQANLPSLLRAAGIIVDPQMVDGTPKALPESAASAAEADSGESAEDTAIDETEPLRGMTTDELMKLVQSMMQGGEATPTVPFEQNGHAS